MFHVPGPWERARADLGGDAGPAGGTLRRSVESRRGICLPRAYAPLFGRRAPNDGTAMKSEQLTEKILDIKRM